MRELPPDAAPRGGVRGAHHIAGRVHRGVLPRGMGPVGVPGDHAPAHRGTHGAHDIRVRGDEPGRGQPRRREGLPGVPSGELLAVAEEEGVG